jgi:hypothetical protein
MFVGLAIGRPRLRRTPRPPDASHAILPHVLRFEASRHARIPSPSCWAFGLGFVARTKKPSSNGFVGKPPNPACSARPPAKPLDSTATVHRLDRLWLRLVRLATMWPAPSPTVHQVPRTEPTCLSISRRPFLRFSGKISKHITYGGTHQWLCEFWHALEDFKRFIEEHKNFVLL